MPCTTRPSPISHSHHSTPPLMSSSYLLLGGLGHGVQGAAVLEPLDLGFVEGVEELDLVVLAILGVDDHGDGLANGKLSAENVNLSTC